MGMTTLRCLRTVFPSADFTKSQCSFFFGGGGGGRQGLISMSPDGSV